MEFLVAGSNRAAKSGEITAKLAISVVYSLTECQNQSFYSLIVVQITWKFTFIGT